MVSARHDADPVPVLVVGDPQDELEGLVGVLQGAVQPVQVTTDEDRALARVCTEVLILAFTRLELAEAFYLRVLKRSAPHRADTLQTIVLCDRTEASKAYDLCRDDVIDDYLVARPLYDPHQFGLCVEQARRRLTVARWMVDMTEARSGPQDIASLVGELETALGAQGQHHPRLVKAIADVRRALGELSSQLDRGAGMVSDRRARAQSTSAASGVALGALEPYSPAAAPAPPAQTETGVTVLVVDDDLVYLHLIRNILESEGYRVVTATDGPAGLVAALDPRVEAVLMDFDLPGLSGLQATRRIRERKPTLPILMLTGHGEPETVKEALRAGMTDFIVKPGKRETILLKLATSLEGSH